MWLLLDLLPPKDPIEGTAIVSTTGHKGTEWNGQGRDCKERAGNLIRIGKVLVTVETEVISRITTSTAATEVTTRREKGESSIGSGDRQTGTTCRLVMPINPRDRTIRVVVVVVEGEEWMAVATVGVGCLRGPIAMEGVAADLGEVEAGVGDTRLLDQDTVS